ncbi:MAG: putative 2-hydroxyacid dehydrogenase [Massilibacillus sp.]|jgi:D-3-phosphoglycerate dehydrogenase|nr:putative 2-hydroxyacid dehydrogenase [Massilibacillus sp.]
MSIIVSMMPKWRFEAAKIDIPENWHVNFINSPNVEDLIIACREAECLLIPAATKNINATVLENIAHIKLIQSAGAGYDGVDTKTAKQLGIQVANVPGQNAHTVAEYTLGLIIALQRSLAIADRETKKGHYTKVRQQLFQQGMTEIAGSSIGLIGVGLIGGEVAKMLSFLGASVSYYSRTRKSAAIEAELGIHYKPLDLLISSSDIISIHTPLTDDTRGLIGTHEFTQMKPSCLIINTARGEIIDQIALADALESGQIDGAAIDVMAPEPLPDTHPLLNLSTLAQDKLLITPHMGGVTVSSFQMMLGKAIENIQRALKGEQPENVVNDL